MTKYLSLWINCLKVLIGITVLKHINEQKLKLDLAECMINHQERSGINKLGENCLGTTQERTEMKNKWYFLIDNQWKFYSFTEFSVELFGFNWQNDYKCIILFGFAFIWEKE